MIVHQRHFAVQRAATIFVNLHPAFDQIVVQQPRADGDDRHIRLALHNQFDAHPAPRGIAHGVQQTVTREEIGVGNDHLALRIGEHFQIVAFNIIPVFIVIAPDKQHLCLTRLAVLFRAMTAFPPATHRRLSRQVFQFEQQNVLYYRAFDFHRIILLGLRAVVGHVFGGVVNAANEGDSAVHDDNFAVHPAKDVGAHPKQRRARIVIAEHHACGGQLVDERVAKIGRAVAVEQHFHFDAPLSRAQHRLV